MVFVELFANKAALTSAVERVGFRCAAPQDLASGGVDFRDWSAVVELLGTWETYASLGSQILFHVAPPCSSFSRARDRSHSTRLRSLDKPQGWYEQDKATMDGNAIALHTAQAVDFLVHVCGASGSWEQPASSYMFPYLEHMQAFGELAFEDIILHQCRYGRPWKKPTIFRVFGDFRPKALGKLCKFDKTSGLHTCGWDHHEELGFGKVPTHVAAEYPTALCATYAGDAYRWATTHSAIDRVVYFQHGKVRRHLDRGDTAASLKEVKAKEDEASTSGARNPHMLMELWPSLVCVMGKWRT